MRYGRLRRGVARERGLSPAPVPDGLIRTALELAVEVARVGTALVPPVPTPRALRPFLRFARLPDRALTVVRRALDDDPEFRGRVALVAATVEDEVGRPGMLFLQRPEGWESELAARADEASALAEAEKEERHAERTERNAGRRVAAAEAAAGRAEEVAAKARLEAQRATAALAEERRLRRAAEAEVELLGSQIVGLEAMALRSAADVERLVGQLAARPPVPVGIDAVKAAVAQERAAAPTIDADAVAEALTRARAAAADVDAALRSAAAALLTESARPRAVPGPSADAPAPSPSPAPTPSSIPSRARGRAAHRRPVALPPAVYDDSAEAAAFLTKVPGVLVLVDGYNAAMALWPELPVPELRRRLIDALAEMAARTGASVHVVFDGAEVTGPPMRSGGRAPVRVSFSAPEVDADDVILELIDGLAPTQAVVVASSDRRVQDGAIERGCNVISSIQLAGVLHR